ncbi:protein-methionine-sulfoxide reductase catalytic subunit MsrP [Nitratireductor kimnyeongensis]|uniref:Protein-methionine-sulfoxide reductase catalytic subunit MsrP n=1 Tax=Nitratireductor kimnyeongensis TaxID=430679 RepID=A0ABW0TA91_9HYPH|nr:protein-methionine-sulfoxide reductase catalytic subunit MsrP [Nitratireductor kimnyeongensis]QZZ36034.1 protein-methionine-sulfoxide reductase catalytic subunit MsrP [Nitratireductor kimnyeongensis]
MLTIHRRPRWAVAENLATPECVFANRRAVLSGLGLGVIAGAGLLTLPAKAQADGDAASRTASLYPAERNEAYQIERPLTPEDVSSTYNNFYEFGSHKQIALAAQALSTHPWDIEIDGLVEKPGTVAFEGLIKRMPLEERLYRHRCVEAWSMTVPWTGFPLSSLLAMAKPLSSARYIRFETFNDPSVAGGQKQVWYPWPYVEGVTIEEASNDLAFLVTGAYGKPLAKQFGAPLRLALPWKYGFKSIKSIRRISFTEKRPVSFWEETAGSEYGFWANVNPDVPHPRWSQAEEQILHTGERIPTQLFNGYAEEVADLYSGLENEQLYR